MKLLPLIILALFFGAGVYWYLTLPASIPVHFSLQGTPDRWTNRSFFSVFMMPMIGLASYLLTVLLAKTIRRYPKSINLPRKEVFRQMTPQEQAPVFDIMERMFLQIDSAILLLMLGIQSGMHLVAIGKAASLPVLVIGAVFGINVVVIIILAIGFGRIDEVLKKYAAKYPKP